MAVITKYVVVRNGVELDKVFAVKKEAEAFDNMLDAAENLAKLIRESNILNDEKIIEGISVFLAQNAAGGDKNSQRRQTPFILAESSSADKHAENKAEEDRSSSEKKKAAKSRTEKQ